MKRKKLLIWSLAILALFLAACGQQGKPAESENKKVSLAVSNQLSQEVWQDTARRLKDKEGIDLEVKLIADWVQPNMAVAENDIDLNVFQYIPFLAEFNQSHKTDLIPIGYSYIPPIGIYSSNPEVQSVADVPQDAKFTIPDDPVNLDHSLLEIERAGLIKLKDTPGQKTLDDIAENPKNIQFILMKGDGIARSLADADLMITGASGAQDAGISQDQAIYIEDPKTTPNIYKVCIVSQRDRADDPLLKKVVDEFQSQETADFIKTVSNGTYVPAWSDHDQATKDYDDFVQSKK
ncbi:MULTISPECIES: MetQ/NlpA family ABC transporter substrate-binding protein [Aerococcus]|nr:MULTISPECIES: MetQ/NlpA family ABC transporter substrate-binding protein [Aerococcus]MDK6369615.1 MetQ/NlpA family ABC transporter substrate-binding protein [Aerococcus sp. UMB9870]MDK6686281.1 MetQ/NlpA family ABC transporter substrate-binding protein [Aerococcus sp. UMB8623]MDK6940201.1 MetQ/NlpA family ABC transporter substrate-binding protein [Aerococcus sp. UMB8487]